MATHSSIFAWIIPWTGKPEGLQFMGSQRVGIIHPGTKFLPICRKQKTSYLFEIHNDKVNIRYQLQTFSSNSGNGKNKSSNKSQTNFTRHQHLRIIPCVCVCVCVCQLLSDVQLFATRGTVVHQAPLSVGFSRQEYWSGLPFPSPGVFSDLGIKPRSPTFMADSLPSEPPGKPNWNHSCGCQLIPPSELVASHPEHVSFFHEK